MLRLLAILLTCALLWACERESPKAETPRTSAAVVSSAEAAPTSNDPPGFYMGRQLAPTMGHEGAPWLVREEREKEERTSVMIEKLGLSLGDTACDLGAGNGYHTLLMAAEVGEGGRVLAADIQPEMLALLKKRAARAGVTNVTTIVAEQTDPRLPARACDLVLMVDVYHELSDPEAVLAKVARALSEEGRLALVEFRAEDPEVPIKPLHKMSKAQIRREMTANGLVLESEYDGLPWQHLMFFVARKDP